MMCVFEMVDDELHGIERNSYVTNSVRSLSGVHVRKSFKKTRIYQTVRKKDCSHYHIKFVQMVSHHIVKCKSMLGVIELG